MPPSDTTSSAICSTHASSRVTFAGETDALWYIRPSGRQRAAADPAFRGPAEAGRGLRSSRVLRLSFGRASQHAAWLCPITRRVSRRGGAANPTIALWPDGLPAAALSSAAADRRDLHARPDERRALYVWGRARHLAGRSRILRRRFRKRYGAVS